MNDKEIQQRAKQALDESTRNLSPKVQRSLYQARQDAMAQNSKPWFRHPLVGFTVAASFSAVLLINYLPQKQGENIPNLVQANIDDFVLLSNFDETDLDIAEDLEFSYWLSEQLENETIPETLSVSELRNG